MAVLRRMVWSLRALVTLIRSVSPLLARICIQPAHKLTDSGNKTHKSDVRAGTAGNDPFATVAALGKPSGATSEFPIMRLYSRTIPFRGFGCA